MRTFVVVPAILAIALAAIPDTRDPVPATLVWVVLTSDHFYSGTDVPGSYFHCLLIRGPVAIQTDAMATDIGAKAAELRERALSEWRQQRRSRLPRSIAANSEVCNPTYMGAELFRDRARAESYYRSRRAEYERQTDENTFLYVF